MLDKIEILYLWDSIALLLDALNYGTKSQVSKSAIEDTIACAETLNSRLPEEEYEMKTGFTCLLLASNTLEELSEGTVSRDIQESLWELLRNIQLSLATKFYTSFADNDIDDIIKNPQYKIVMENIVKDYMLGDYRL